MWPKTEREEIDVKVQLWANHPTDIPVEDWDKFLLVNFEPNVLNYLAVGGDFWPRAKKISFVMRKMRAGQGWVKNPLK